MADAATIADLRRLIDQPDTTAPWTDAYLGTRIDGWTGTLNSLAATIWREKAGAYSGLVDIQEGNSSRKLSQLQAQALKMADGLDGGDIASARRPATTRRIERL